MFYVGIDPGAKGGIAVIGKRIVTVHKMPETDTDLWNLLVGIDFHNREDTATMLERVHSMPSQGVSSVFTFGVGYGKLQMGLCAAGMSYELVQPEAWQKALKIPPRKKAADKKGKAKAKREHKKNLLVRAQRLFPKVKLTLATADALLIALYCKRFHEGTL